MNHDNNDKDKDKRYYMVPGDDGVIWGIGESEEEAVRDAEKQCFDDDVELFDAVPCSKDLFDYVQEMGSGTEDLWMIARGVAELKVDLMVKEVLG